MIEKLNYHLLHLTCRGPSFNFFRAWTITAILLGLGFSLADLFTTKHDILTKEVGIAVCIALLLAMACGFALINLTVFSKFNEKLSPKTIMIANVIMIMFTCLATTAFFTSASALTPFHTIDATLHQADLSLGFNQNYWVELIYSQPFTHKLLETIYFSLYVQMAILPLIAVFLVPAEKIYQYFGRVMMLGVIGTSIYYLFPTTAPTIFLNKDHLVFDQINLILQFEQIHAGTMPDHITMALIGFPSFHVIWALLLCSLFKNTKLFLPVIIYNSIVCFSTILLGWHYFMDVIASCALVTLSISLSKQSLLNEFHQDLQLIENQIISLVCHPLNYDQ